MFHLKNPMENLYEEAGLPRDERHSLNCILCANICGGMYGIVCQATSSAMVGLTALLGANDFIFGLITAIIQATCLLQLPFSMLIQRTGKRKLFMLCFGAPARLLWVLLGFLPLLFPESHSLALGILLALLSVFSVLMAAPSIAWYSWFSDLAPLGIRSRWLSLKETFCAVMNFLFGLLIAYLLDHIQGEYRFAIVFAAAGLLGTLDMCLFGFAKEIPMAKQQQKSLSDILHAIFQNKPFMRFTLMWTVWCFCSNMSSTYLTPYSMNIMGLNNMQIMLFGTMVSSMATALAMPRWGRLLTHTSSQRVMTISCLITCMSPFVYLFSSPGNIWPTLLYNLIGSLSWSGCNLTAAHMQLELSTPEIRPSYLAIFNTLTAILGTTLGSLAGGTFLSAAESVNLHFGFMDRYMILIVAADVLRIAGVLLFSKKQKQTSIAGNSPAD